MEGWKRNPGKPSLIRHWTEFREQYNSSINAIFLPWSISPVGQGLLFFEDLWSNSDTPHSVGLLWTSDQPHAETSTWQHIPLTRDKHPCPRRDSSPQCQKARGNRPTPYTAWPLETAVSMLAAEEYWYSLTFSRLMTYIYVVPHRWLPDVAFYIFIQHIYVLNILNMLHTLRFFLFKMPFIS